MTDRPRLTIAHIQHQVAKAYGIDPRLMTSPRRAKACARPRQVAMWLVSHLMPGASLPQIGRAFGRRDHATVMYGIRKVDEIRARDPAFADLVDGLRLAIVQEVASFPTGDQVLAERLAVSLADAFEAAVLALARSDCRAALQVFAPLVRQLLGEPDREAL